MFIHCIQKGHKNMQKNILLGVLIFCSYEFQASERQTPGFQAPDVRTSDSPTLKTPELGNTPPTVPQRGNSQSPLGRRIGKNLFLSLDTPEASAQATDRDTSTVAAVLPEIQAATPAAQATTPTCQPVVQEPQQTVRAIQPLQQSVLAAAIIRRSSYEPIDPVNSPKNHSFARPAPVIDYEPVFRSPSSESFVYGTPIAPKAPEHTQGGSIYELRDPVIGITPVHPVHKANI